MPVLYVLSIGPAGYLIERTGKGQSAAHVVNAPLIWPYKVAPQRWYERLWTDR
jgi:hypothetical protein